MKILVNALSGIGDAIMFSPAISLLKKHLPDSQIDMLAMFNQVKNLYDNNPNVNSIYFIDFLHQSKIKSLKEVFAIRRNKYDISINVYPSNRIEYNILNLMLGAKKRIGTRYNNYSKINFDFLNTDLIQEIKDKHNVLENYELIKKLIPDSSESDLKGLEVYLNEEDLLYADNFIKENGLENKLFIGYHAGSAIFKGHINKRWDWKNYAELALKLNEKLGALILLFGTENDVNENILSKYPEFVIIPPNKNIMKSIALMNKCKLFISNDTALMHLSAGLNIPTIGIFGYTNYKELYPWMNKHIIVRKELDCSPCFFNSPKPVKCIYYDEEEYKCIRTISVEEVFKAAWLLIQEIPS
jgi:heptosyltransferase II